MLENKRKNKKQLRVTDSNVYNAEELLRRYQLEYKANITWVKFANLLIERGIVSLSRDMSKLKTANAEFEGK